MTASKQGLEITMYKHGTILQIYVNVVNASQVGFRFIAFFGCTCYKRVVVSLSARPGQVQTIQPNDQWRHSPEIPEDYSYRGLPATCTLACICTPPVDTLTGSPSDFPVLRKGSDMYVGILTQGPYAT